ncbi:MAG: hypothetical protein A2Y71_12080 [Bacteroidetes bacterium RBG_13_42_15]|nr:MAG: hypothetical protein A2Y71_12080 [Bacteroidetes bacterium RBG_13_42_15]
MPEDQNIEYKESWRDEYLKWICGFANVNGGKIVISDYQNLNDISRETATRDLKELIDRQLIKSSGQKGAGAFYTLL